MNNDNATLPAKVITTHTEMLPICNFYVNDSVTKTDVQKNVLLSIYSSRFIGVYSTVTEYDLTREDARSIAMSSVERYSDETYENYKIRMKARDAFNSVYKKVFDSIEKSRAKKLD